MWAEFLQVGTRTAKLSVNLPSGRPSVTPVWFLHEDGIIRIQTGPVSAKAKALTADSPACLIVDLEKPPYALIKIDATATIIDDSDLTLRVATDIGGLYMGADHAEEFVARNGGPCQIPVWLAPTRVTAIRDISD